ncbi:hypothetical protein ACFX2I_011242 [Malus domestica]
MRTTMKKFISTLHLQIQKTPLLQWRTLMHAIYQSPPSEPPDFSQTIASTHAVFSIPCFNLLVLCRNIDSLKKVHSLIVLHGLADNLLCRTKLISLYGSFGYIKCARYLFDKMTNPDFYSWKVMLRWYFMQNLYEEVIGFYNRMRMCAREHDNAVFLIVLKACSELRDLDKGRKVHCRIVKVASPDSFVLTGLVDVYAKCGWIECSWAVFDGIVVVRNVNGIGLKSFLVISLLDLYVKCGDIGDARSIFDEFCGIDLVSWTAMIVGYTQCGYPDKALELFMDWKWVGLLPNSITTASVLSSCAQSGNLNLGRSIHGLGIKLGLEESTVRNALVDMYAKCRMISDSRYIFLKESPTRM